MVQILGLDICKDTIVGDDMQRGISGGQKKRVTTGQFPPFVFLPVFRIKRSIFLSSSLSGGNGHLFN